MYRYTLVCLYVKLVFVLPFDVLVGEDALQLALQPLILPLDVLDIVPEHHHRLVQLFLVHLVLLLLQL